MAGINDSTKKKELLDQERKPSSKLSDRLGVSTGNAAQSGAPIDAELEATATYWKDAVQTLRGEEFASLELAVERVVELAAEKLGSLAADTRTKAFMKSALLDSEEMVELLEQTLQIK